MSQSLPVELGRLVHQKTISQDRETCTAALREIHVAIPGSIFDEEKSILFWGHTDLATSRWLIHTHLDVVPADDTQFKLTTKGDKAWGRGAADVKGCVTMLTTSAEA
jgi:acetylornithine deacetylase/succinyl-diaminopimelate desuccinylase-like protein